MADKQSPKPPRHLKAPTKRWWKSVVDGYSLEPHHVRLLTLAAEAWDPLPAKPRGPAGAWADLHGPFRPAQVTSGGGHRERQPYRLRPTRAGTGPGRR